METSLFVLFCFFCYCSCFSLTTFPVSTSGSPKVQMLQCRPDLDQCGECWVCTDQIQAALGWECGARNQTGGLSALEVLSADVTDFQGLEITFRSCTAGPQVDDTRTTAPHPSELSTWKTSARVVCRPISEDVLQGDRMRLHTNFYVCQQFVSEWNLIRWRDAALFDEWRAVE